MRLSDGGVRSCWLRTDSALAKSRKRGRSDLVVCSSAATKAPGAGKASQSPRAEGRTSRRLVRPAFGYFRFRRVYDLRAAAPNAGACAGDRMAIARNAPVSAPVVICTGACAQGQQRCVGSPLCVRPRLTLELTQGLFEEPMLNANGSEVMLAGMILDWSHLLDLGLFRIPRLLL